MDDVDDVDDLGAAGWEDRVERLLAFRREKDAFFREHPHSPLPHDQRHAFTGLSYYPPEPQAVMVLQPEAPADPEPFVVETSTGEQQAFRRTGVVRFTVGGQPASLTLLARADGHDHGLFVPFRDATSGTETYGAGRYIDLGEEDIAPDGRVRLDFNDAYNPSCAYNPHYSCPLPPPDNWLRVPIRAGERAYVPPGGHAH